MFNFDLQRFGRSTTTNISTPVNGATQLTETGKEIEGINRDYLRVLSPILQNLANTGGAQVGTSITPDYNSMYGTGMNQINNANAGLNGLSSSYNGLNNGYSALNNDYANKSSATNNQYSTLNNNYSNSANAYQQGVNNVNNQYSGALNKLANGELSDGYKASMSAAVQSAMSPYANGLGNLADSGIINSSVGKQWATDASTAASTAANNAYNNSMSTASGVANNAYNSALSGANTAAGLNANTYSNQLSGLNNLAGNQATAYSGQMSGLNNLSNNYGNMANLYNNQISAAANPYNYAAGFQSAAGSNAKDLLSLATGSYSPVGSTFSDYLKAGTGQSSSSRSTDNSGLFSLIGTGAGLAFCFVAGTPVSTPHGDTNIEHVTVGNIVSTLLGDMPVEKTIHTSDMPVVKVMTDKGDVTCTESEVLLTVDGPQSVRNLIEGDVLIRKDGGATVISIVDAGIADVYEIVVPWFYANGFVVDGFDPEVE